MPGTRPIINTPNPNFGSKPKSDKIAAFAPSTFKRMFFF